MLARGLFAREPYGHAQLPPDRAGDRRRQAAGGADGGNRARERRCASRAARNRAGLLPARGHGARRGRRREVRDAARRGLLLSPGGAAPFHRHQRAGEGHGDLFAAVPRAAGKQEAMMARMLFTVLVFLSLAGCASSEKAPGAAVSDLAPNGKLRAAINLGNPVLALRDPAGGEPRGVSVDMARELARRLGFVLPLIPFDSAGQVVASGQDGHVWTDIV